MGSIVEEEENTFQMHLLKVHFRRVEVKGGEGRGGDGKPRKETLLHAYVRLCRVSPKAQ